MIGRHALGLPIADAPALGHAARRARILRALLVCALVGLVGAAVALATRNSPAVAVAAPASAPVTEVVLDVSGSVGNRTFGFTERALRRLSRGGPVGLIVFSDSAEEALPPGTPAVELTPLVRLFRPVREPAAPAGYPSASSRYPMSPWYVSFSGGTRISAGLAAAREALTRDHVRGRIVLISDLGDAADDLAKMKRELVALEQAGIELRVMPLPNTFARDLKRFHTLEGPEVANVALTPQRPPAQTAGISVPASLAALAVLLAFALAANELYGVSLRWRERS